MNSVVCWGSEEYSDWDPPLAGSWRKVSSGGAGTCALADDGTLACWGWYPEADEMPSGTGFTDVAAGFDQVCALDAAGYAAAGAAVGHMQLMATFNFFRSMPVVLRPVGLR